MKRAGFTMIELIFVIVILGILAAVAIPKLAATRTDAEVSKGATEFATAMSDIGSYYTAQGAFGAVSDMTNVDFNGTTTGASGTTAEYHIADVSCVTIAFKADGNITVAQPAQTASACLGLQGATADLVGDHSFGGSSVSY